MSERKEGWYWVRPNDEDDRWLVARYEPGRIVGGEDRPWIFSALSWPDSFWSEIGPRIPAPDEAWQTVPAVPTLEMKNIFDEYHARIYHPSSEYRCAHTWQAMLKAAPTPSQEV